MNNTNLYSDNKNKISCSECTNKFYPRTKNENVCMFHKKFLLHSPYPLREVEPEKKCICRHNYQQENAYKESQFYQLQIDKNSWNDISRNKEVKYSDPFKNHKKSNGIINVNDYQTICKEDTGTQFSIDNCHTNNNTMSRWNCKVEPESPTSQYDYQEDICKTVSSKTLSCDSSNIICHVSKNNIQPINNNKKKTMTLVVCSKCGGELGNKRKTDKCCKYSKSNVTDSKKTKPSHKTSCIEKEKESQIYGIGLTETYRFKCGQSIEDEDRILKNNDAPAKSVENLKACSNIICKYAPSKQMVKTNRVVQTGNDINMNEAVMAKREEVWGNNIPPEFIIKGTIYACRHAECCLNNKNIGNSNLKYFCPKNRAVGKPTTLICSDCNMINVNGSNCSIECVLMDDEITQVPQNDYSRKSSTEDENIVCCTSNRSCELCQPKCSEQCARTNTKSPKKPKKQVKTMDSMKHCKNDCLIRSHHKNKPVSDVDVPKLRTLAFICNEQIENDELSDDSCNESETIDEPEDCNCQKKCDIKPSKAWYEKINEQVRSFLNLNRDSDEELVMAEELTDDIKKPEDKYNQQQPVLRCVLALTPELERIAKENQARDKSNQQKVLSMVLALVPELERMARDNQISKDSFTRVSVTNAETQTLECQGVSSKHGSHCVSLKKPVSQQPRRVSVNKKAQTSFDSIRSFILHIDPSNISSTGSRFNDSNSCGCSRDSKRTNQSPDDYIEPNEIRNIDKPERRNLRLSQSVKMQTYESHNEKPYTLDNHESDKPNQFITNKRNSLNLVQDDDLDIDPSNQSNNARDSFDYSVKQYSDSERNIGRGNSINRESLNKRNSRDLDEKPVYKSNDTEDRDSYTQTLISVRKKHPSELNDTNELNDRSNSIKHESLTKSNSQDLNENTVLNSIDTEERDNYTQTLISVRKKRPSDTNELNNTNESNNTQDRWEKRN